MNANGDDSILIEADRLSVSYQGATVLREVSFQVRAGDYVGIVGPNGSGKTTLLKALLGYVGLSGGLARLCGVETGRFDQWHRIGYLPQNSPTAPAGFPVTAEEVVGTGLLPGKRFLKRLSRGDRNRIHEALEEVGAAPLAKSLIGRLSGGQRQRVFLARTLVGQPDLLLLDEPTTALDPDFRELFFQLLRARNESRNVTILLVTHDNAGIGLQARQFMYLDGRLVFFGSFSDFCHSPAMTRYFGSDQQHHICHQHDHEHSPV